MTVLKLSLIFTFIYYYFFVNTLFKILDLSYLIADQIKLRSYICSAGSSFMWKGMQSYRVAQASPRDLRVRTTDESRPEPSAPAGHTHD